ncbi:hypothetical protein PPERSA_01002 [Pseudocohnilembus persalinus]|uniref:Histidine phosphatase superfamily, clade-2 n=1 Tax=Pseudocohnilembus persalinus TaxID=266149 RepID=A0A0V0QUM8_PSEPJ|nr:hypothetical protein PPERSA_01002 [Pseudocohnilembus persalinus]|eukprot:KRX05924.1 hypothetical protein PPERSA_01002 [Pseudocohnilembus persalinus]
MQKICLLISIILANLATFNCTLRLVIQQYRHGARGTYNGKYLGNTSEEDIYMEGELTPVGQRQHYVLGKHLREEYGDFLDETFSQSQMYVRSININRTLQSAQSQLYGLYPNGLGDVLPENLNLEYTLPPYKGAQPIENIGDYSLPKGKQNIQIHSMLKDYDPLLSPESALICPNYQGLKKAFLSSDKYQFLYAKIEKQMQVTVSKISTLLGQNLSIKDFPGLWDNIMCNVNAGLYVPEELLPGYKLYNDVNYVSNIHSFMYMDDLTLRKLANFNLINQYLKYLDSAYNGNTSFRWYMVSASDTNLQYVMPLLNITSIDCIMEQYDSGTYSQLNCQQKPRFATSMMIELHENDDMQDKVSDKYYVKIKFNGVYQNLCGQKNQYCAYTEFKQRIQNSMMSQEEYDNTCGLSQQKPEQEQNWFQNFFNKYIFE